LEVDVDQAPRDGVNGVIIQVNVIYRRLAFQVMVLLSKLSLHEGVSKITAGAEAEYLGMALHPDTDCK
jgi:hypothetical protein